MSLLIPSTTFRNDINGLRAWAVLAVVLFHFSVPGFSGGFVGVDIFFVISGFLMTRIIISGLEKPKNLKNFSLFNFYLSRARRIIPALLVLCLSSISLAWWILPAPDYKSLATHTIASLLFISNIQFWREAGYFDIASHEKWLLHTWSLSVEWQFYVIFPLALVFVWKIFPGRRNALIAILIGFITSLIYAIWQTNANPSSAFFLLPSRAWEMLAGAVVALICERVIAKSWQSQVLEAMGFLLILISIFSANPEIWPGYQALLPVIGTALVLIASRQNSILTSTPVFQRIGNWSYSIYLWHWPIAVALTYLGWQNNPSAIVFGLLFSIFFGWVSYHWFENLGRIKLLNIATKYSVAIIFSATALLLVTAITIRMGQGIPGRLSTAAEKVASQALNANPRRSECHIVGGSDFHSCIFGGPNISVILMGDSHANSVVGALEAALPSSKEGILAFSYTSCPTIFGAKLQRKDLNCAEFNEWVMLEVRELPANVPIIIVNRSSSYPFGTSHDQGQKKRNPLVTFDDAPLETYSQSLLSKASYLRDYQRRMVSSICRIAKDRPVYLLRPLPEMPADVPRFMARSIQLGRSTDVSTPVSDYRSRHAFIWAAQDQARDECNATLIDPLPYFCNEKACYGSDKGMPLYYDDNHLSEIGNRKLRPAFEIIFQDDIPPTLPIKRTHASHH